MIVNIPFLIIALFLLVALSAFFSGSETGMMSLNRYRLRYMARKGDYRARRVVKLLERPDRLLGVILLGNTFANILSSAIATVLFVHFFGEFGVLLSTLVLTVVVLIFSEAAPKTLAALHPLRVAFFSSLTLRLLLSLFYPIVFLVNTLANGFLRLFKVCIERRTVEPLSTEELRSVLHEASGKISSSYQKMLLRILDMDRVIVEDVMVPRNEIMGINLEEKWDDILLQLRLYSCRYVPVYQGNVNKACGILDLRKAFVAIQTGRFNQQSIRSLSDQPYFIPEGALISQQLLNFQRQQRSMGLVVDEYGDIQGLITLQDIIEEIIGGLSFDREEFSHLLKQQNDGSYLINGDISVRELNRLAAWDLPTKGPRTLSGLIIEHLGTIPSVGIAARIAGYPMEVIRVSSHRIRQVRVWPLLKLTNKKEII